MQHRKLWVTIMQHFNLSVTIMQHCSLSVTGHHHATLYTIGHWPPCKAEGCRSMFRSDLYATNIAGYRMRAVTVQELCESRGGRSGLPVLMSLMVSVNVKQHRTMLTHWSQFVNRHRRALSSTSSSKLTDGPAAKGLLELRSTSPNFDHAILVLNGFFLRLCQSKLNEADI